MSRSLRDYVIVEKDVDTTSKVEWEGEKDYCSREEFLEEITNFNKKKRNRPTRYKFTWFSLYGPSGGNRVFSHLDKESSEYDNLTIISERYDFDGHNMEKVDSQKIEVPLTSTTEDSLSVFFNK